MKLLVLGKPFGKLPRSVERLYRPVSDLRPGRTQAVEYRISNGAHLVGSKVRLGLLELNDGLRRHNLELIVP